MSTGDAAVEPRKGAWFPCFDGLRAIAAITVVFHHAGFATGAEFRSWGQYPARMDSGVTIFFLISGFLLYRPYVAAHLDERQPMAPVRFYQRRLLRIFPAYWVCLAGVVLFFGYSLPTFTDVVVHGGLFQIYDIHRYFNAMSQSWTLATELSFYLVVPAFAWLVRRLASGRARTGRMRTELVVLVIVFVSGLAVRSLCFPVTPHESPAWKVLLRYWLPANMDLFAVGMAMAVVSVALAGRDREAQGWAMRVFPYLSWALGIAAFVYVADNAGLPLGLQDASPAGEWRKHLAYLGYSFGLVLPAVFGPQTSVLHRVLRWKPIAALGVVSYGIYLWHQAWIHQVMLWRDDELFKTPYWQVVLPALALTIATAAASYWLVEKPCLRLKDRRPRRPVEAREEAVVAAAPAP